MKHLLSNNFLLSFSLVLLFFAISPAAHAQAVSGVLVDQNTGKTIPFADVQIGEHYGVITNIEGDFIVNVAGFQPTDSLVFSSMGYRQKAIALKDYKQDTVFLSPRVNQLATVYLTGKELTPRQVIDSVRAHLTDNYDFSGTQFTVFRRNKNTMTPQKIGFDVKKARNLIDKNTVKRFNKTIDSISKASKGNTVTTYNALLADGVINEKDSIKMRLDKATSLMDKERTVKMSDFVVKIMDKMGESLKTDNTFKVRTGIIPLGDSVNVAEIFESDKDSIKVDSLHTSSVVGSLTDVLNQTTFREEGEVIAIMLGGAVDGQMISAFIREPDDYEYTIEGMTRFNDDFVYILSFKPDRGLFGNQGRYTGTLYVTTGNYAIVKADYHLAEGEHGTKFNFKFLLGVKYVEKGRSGTVIYQPNGFGKYMPKYVRLNSHKYAYFNRNFVLKENVKGRRNRIKLKFEITLEFDNKVQDEWVFINTRSLQGNEFEAFQANQGVVDQHLEQYNPKVWEGHNTLAPTEAIKEYNQ